MPKKERRSQRITINLTQSLKKLIKEMSIDEDISINTLISQAVKDYAKKITRRKETELEIRSRQTNQISSPRTVINRRTIND